MLQSALPTELESITLDRLSRNGLSEEPRECVKFNDEPKIPTYICVPNKKAKDRYHYDDVYGCGISSNPTVAKIKSIAEFLERLAIYNPQKRVLLKHEYEEGLCIDPNLFMHYSDNQVKAHGYARNGLEKNAYLWSAATDWLSKKKILVPSQLIYLSDMFKDEVAITPEQISTGAAFGGSVKHAFETGFLEVIERDAFMISYLTKRKIARVTGFPESVNRIINYLKRYYIDMFVFDVTNDLEIPVFMAIAVDRQGLGVAVSVGMKSGFDPESAIVGSIMESVQARRQSRFSKEMEGDKFHFPKANEIESKQDRYFYWYPVKMIGHLDFWLKGSRFVSFSKLDKYVSSIGEGVKQLSERGYHVIYADMTLDPIKKIGFFAGKVLIPELQPLYLSERLKVLYSVHGGDIIPSKGLKPHPFT